jgi:hypothetical protein
MIQVKSGMMIRNVQWMRMGMPEKVPIFNEPFINRSIFLCE